MGWGEGRGRGLGRGVKKVQGRSELKVREARTRMFFFPSGCKVDRHVRH